jgi:hypothetical protein
VDLVALKELVVYLGLAEFQAWQVRVESLVQLEWEALAESLV